MTTKKKTRSPLIGKEIWTLTLTNDYGSGRLTTVSAHTSFEKALKAARMEFKEHGLLPAWKEAKRELTDQFFWRDPEGVMFRGDRFLIDCTRISD